VGSLLPRAVVACAIARRELRTNSFSLAPFAVGAAIAAVLAALGAGGVVAVVAAILLLLLPPIAIRHRRSLPSLRSATAALVGQRALVLERIANRGALGTAKIGAEVWIARACDGHVIGGDEQVEVAIRGAAALVMP